MSGIASLVAVVWLVLAAAARPAVAEETRVPIRMFDGLPLVAVSVNGAAPHWFFADTGSSVTTLSTSFAAELGLAAVDDLEIETMSATIAASVGTVQSFRVGTTELGGGAVVWHSLERLGVPRDVDGILGFDRLGRLNFLLDYGTRTLRLDPDGALTSALRGERVAFTRSMGRPVVDVVVQVRNDPERMRRLVVDTGATTAVLLDRVAPEPDLFALATVAGAAHARPAPVSVRLGGRTSWQIAAVIVERRDDTSRDDQGLLPASLFSWMYFDVRRGEIVWQRAG